MLLNKKTLLLSIILMSFSISCNLTRNSKKSDLNSEGFITNHIYRVISEGKPYENEKDKRKRKTLSLKHAILSAKATIFNNFYSYHVEGGFYAFPYEYKRKHRMHYISKYKQVVENGRIIKEKYDDRQNCYIIYQVEKKGLKNFIMLDDFKEN